MVFNDSEPHEGIRAAAGSLKVGVIQEGQQLTKTTPKQQVAVAEHSLILKLV